MCLLFVFECVFSSIMSYKWLRLFLVCYFWMQNYEKSRFPPRENRDILRINITFNISPTSPLFSH